MHNEAALGVGWVLAEHTYSEMQMLLSDGSEGMWKRALGKSTCRLHSLSPLEKSSFVCVLTLIFSLCTIDSLIIISSMKKKETRSILKQYRM